MKKASYLIFVFILLTVISSCAKKKTEKVVLVAIGKYFFYQEDFFSEAALYPPAYRQTLTKEQILEELIQKKILLMEAQRQGLDKDPEFMKMVERFWQQSLLRSLLDKKSDEIMASMDIANEKERSQKASQIMQNWIDELRKNAKIKINKEALEKIELK